MKNDIFKKVIEFLDRLDASKISYRMWKHLEDAVSIEARAPGEHWEIDFFADGDVYVERFKSNGHIDDESVFAELFALCSDQENSVAKTANHALVSRTKKAVTQ